MKKNLAIIQKWNNLEHGSWFSDTEYLFEDRYLSLHIFYSNDDEDSYDYNFEEILDILNQIKEWRRFNPRLDSQHILNYDVKLAVVENYKINNLIFANDNTHLITKIQKKWKKYFRKKYFSVKNIKHREIYCVFPNYKKNI